MIQTINVVIQSFNNYKRINVYLSSGFEPIIVKVLT